MFDQYHVPDGHIFLENELISINSTVKPLIENYTNTIISTMGEEFIDYLMFGVRKLDNDSIRKILSISCLAIPFINTMLVKNRAKASTLIKANGFSLGLLGGSAIAYRAYATAQNVPFKKQVVKWLATEGLMYTLKSNPKLNVILYSFVNKIAISIFKMPEHEISIGDFLKEPDVLFNPSTLLRMFLTSALMGVILGFIIFKYTYSALFKSKGNVNLLQIFMNRLKGETRDLAIYAMLEDLKSLTKPISQLKIKHEKPDQIFPKMYQEYIATTAYRATHKFTKSNVISKILSKSSHIIQHNLSIFNNKQISEIYVHFEHSVEQAISLLKNLIGAKLFEQSVNDIYIVLEDHDNAYVKLSKKSRKKCDIYICMNKNITQSVWVNLTVREIAAVIAHEFGHFYGGAFKLLPAVKLTYLAINVAKGIYNDQVIEILMQSAIAYSTISFAKLAEIQADSFAIKLGLGKELHTALSKIVNTSDIIDEFGQLTTHGGNLSRIQGIRKWAKIYTKLKKQVR